MYYLVSVYHNCMAAHLTVIDCEDADSDTDW
jgi:hypothetical protein